MATLDPRSIKPDNHKKIRKIDGSQSVAKLRSLESSTNAASKEYAPILQAVIELVKLYQSDANLEEDDRVLKLANLILDRHTALLDTLTKDANSWKNVKKYIEAKIGDQILQYNVDNSNSAKADVSVVTKKINDAITKALIEHNKRNKAPADVLIEQSEKKETTIELNDAIVKEKTTALMQTKEYKNFLGELKRDFEGFAKDYDSSKKILIDNYKKALAKNIIRQPPKKNSILAKFADAFKSKQLTKKDREPKKSLNPFRNKLITKKDREPKKSLNPFRSFDVAGLVKNVAHGIQTFVGASVGIVVKFFSSSGKVFKAVHKLLKSLVFGVVGAMAGMLKGFLNLFGRGPILAIFSMLFLPIKLILKGIMFVVKPLVKLITGLAKIILAPIKILVMGPIKLIKGIGSFVKGALHGILKLLNKRTMAFLFKTFLMAGGAYMLGYIIGTIWKNWIQPVWLKITDGIIVAKALVNKILGYLNNDKNDSYFAKMFSRDEQFQPGTFSYRLHRIILAGYSIYEEIAHITKVALGNAESFFKAVFNSIYDSIPVIKFIYRFVTSKVFQIAVNIFNVIRRGCSSPLAKVFRNCSGILKIAGIGVSIAMEALRKIFKFWSRDAEEKPELDNAFKEGVKKRTDKQLDVMGLSDESKNQYASLYNGVNTEINDIPELSKTLNELLDISKQTNGKLSEYPEFIQKVITSYALGQENPETFAIPPDFAKYDADAQHACLFNILNARKDRAGRIAGVLSTGNKEQLIKLLDTVKNDSKALSIGVQYVKDPKTGKTKRVSYQSTFAKIDSMGNSKETGLVIGNTTLKAIKGGSQTVKKDDLSKEQFEAMQEAGLIQSSDGNWFTSASEYTIDISPDKLEAYKQKYLEKRKKSILNDQIYAHGLFANVSPTQKAKIQQAMENYFNANDISNLSDKDIRADLYKIINNVKDGKKYNVEHGKIDVKEEFKSVEDKVDQAEQELSQVDNGSNTVVVNNTSANDNPAAVEAQRKE